LNIKTDGHLILSKIARFLCYLTLKSGLYHFILGDSVVYPYCKGTWLYSQKSYHDGQTVRIHIVWFLKYSTLKSGQRNIKLLVVSMSGPYHFILGDVHLDKVVFIHTAKVCGCTHKLSNLRIMFAYARSMVP